MRALGHRSRRLSRSESVQFSFAQIRRPPGLPTGTNATIRPEGQLQQSRTKRCKAKLMGGILPSSRQEFCEIDHGRQDSVTGSPDCRIRTVGATDGPPAQDDCNRRPASASVSVFERHRSPSPATSSISLPASRTIKSTVQQFTRPDAAARNPRRPSASGNNVAGTC